MKILIIEDSKTQTGIIRRVLEPIPQLDCQFAVDAFDGYAALDGDGDFDIVIIDQNMEPVDGFTLLKKLKSVEKLSNLKIVLSSSQELNKKFERVSYDGFLEKPYTTESVLEVINDLS